MNDTDRMFERVRLHRDRYRGLPPTEEQVMSWADCSCLDPLLDDGTPPRREGGEQVQKYLRQLEELDRAEATTLMSMAEERAHQDQMYRRAHPKKRTDVVVRTEREMENDEH
jgi:hypothetical protein